MVGARRSRVIGWVLAVVLVCAGNVGCQVPADWAALVALSWVKDLVIGDKLRIDFLTPPDGCYQNGQMVDCATMQP